MKRNSPLFVTRSTCVVAIDNSNLLLQKRPLTSLSLDKESQTLMDKGVHLRATITMFGQS
jgi:hypothetical protein